MRITRNILFIISTLIFFILEVYWFVSTIYYYNDMNIYMENQVIINSSIKLLGTFLLLLTAIFTACIKKQN